MGLIELTWCPICFKYCFFDDFKCEEHPDEKCVKEGVLFRWWKVEEIKQKRQIYLRQQKLERICND